MNTQIASYLSHWSALEFYKPPFIDSLIKPASWQRPLEFTVRDRRHVYTHPQQQVHVCELPHIEEHFIEVQGVRVVSPELMFVQCCSFLTLHQALILGHCLCASLDGESEGITTVAKLREFIKQAKYLRGRRHAKRLVRYIKDMSRSPMEIMSDLLIGLPHLLGGHGLRGGVYNHKITLTNTKTGKRRVVYADIFFKKARLVIEYDSWWIHFSSDQIKRDDAREALLRAAGYQVIRFRREDIYDLSLFEEKIREIARCLGNRIRVRTHKMARAFVELRDLLPRHEDDSDISERDYTRRRQKEVLRYFRRLEIPFFPEIDYFDPYSGFGHAGIRGDAHLLWR